MPDAPVTTLDTTGTDHNGPSGDDYDFDDDLAQWTLDGDGVIDPIMEYIPVSGTLVTRY